MTKPETTAMKLDKARLAQFEQAKAKLGEAKAIIDAIWKEDEAAFSDHPKHWQESETGEQIMEYLDDVDCLSGEIANAIDSVAQITGEYSGAEGEA